MDLNQLVQLYSHLMSIQGQSNVFEPSLKILADAINKIIATADLKA